MHLHNVRPLFSWHGLVNTRVILLLLASIHASMVCELESGLGEQYRLAEEAL